MRHISARYDSLEGEDSDSYKGSGGSASSSDEGSEEAGEDRLRCDMRESEVFRQFSDGSAGIQVGKLKEALQELHFEETDLQDLQPGVVDEDDDDAINREEFRHCVNNLLVKEARRYAEVAQGLTREVQKQILKHGQDLSGLEEALDKLHRCWKRVTVQKFLRWLQAMEDHPREQNGRVEMLDSLILRLPDASYLNDDGTGIRKHTSFGKLHGDTMNSGNVVVILSDKALPLTGGKGKSVTVDFRQRSRPLVDKVQNYLLGTVREKYMLAYFTLPLLQSDEIHRVVNELESASVDSKIFETLIVSALLTKGWHLARPTFYIGLLLDSVIIVILSLLANYARNQQMAGRCCIVTLLCISSAYFLNELCVAWVRRKGFVDSFWKFYEMMVTVYFFVIMVLGCFLKRDLVIRAEPLKAKQEAWLHDHAIWVEFLVFFKTSHFAIKLLCIRALGERVIPAYKALTHRSSVGLLVFLFILYCNSVLTFHTVPVEIYSPDEKDKQRWDYWENLFDSGLLQFRLAFLGESQPDELEASNQRVRLNVTHQGTLWEGEVIGPSTHTRYHHGVQLTGVLFLVLIHILVLNVYIGVLSQQYHNYVPKERELFEKLRAFFTGKILTAHHIFWPRCLRQRWRQHTTTWIAYKQSLFEGLELTGDQVLKFSEGLELTDEDRTHLRRIFASPRKRH